MDFKVCICVCDFDLVVGQTVKVQVPQGVLSEGERKQVAYHAFPDSKSIELSLGSQRSIHDTLFHFRIKHKDSSKGKDGGNAPPSSSAAASRSRARSGSGSKVEYDPESKELAVVATTSEKEDKWHYAYSFCRQRQDASLPRGGDQKSIVVLANRPYMAILQQITKFAGELYFNQGESSLKQIIDSVHGWKQMKPSSTLSIKVDDFRLPVTVPERRRNAFDFDAMDVVPLDADTRITESQARMRFSKVCTYSALSGLVKHVWHIWEVMLLAEPCMIFGSNPEIVASCVSAAMDLIYPLPYNADYRPYFTIHDPEFGGIQDASNCSKEGNPSLIGVTNTYFLKAYNSWPHILAVGGGDSTGGLAYSSPMSSPRSPRGGGWGKSWFSFRGNDRSNLINLVDSYTQELYSVNPSTVKANYKVLGSLDLVSDDANEMQWATSASVNTKILRKHFQQLTEAFLSLFDPYFKPKGGPDSGYAAKFVTRPFPQYSNEDFIASLASRSSFPLALTQNVEIAKLPELYNKFVHSTNFRPWFDSRLKLAKVVERGSWIETRLGLDITPVIETLDEFERVDLYEIIKKQVAQETQTIGADQKLLKKLRTDLDTLFYYLPDSLQPMMLNQTMKDCFLDSDESGQLQGRFSAPEGTFKDVGKSPFKWFQSRIGKKAPDKTRNFNPQ